MKKCFSLFLILAFILHPSSFLLAATGCNYPASLDSFTDKQTGDFFTVGDVNARSCAIEKLETGPLRPNKGSASAPAYSYQGDTDTGVDSLAADQLDFITGGSSRVKISTSGGLEPVGSTPIRATIGPGTWQSIGQVSFNNSGAPNTSFDLTAKVVVLRNSSHDVVVRHAPSSVTNSISTSGPAANGRDQSGAFSNNSWVHFYWIWNGTTLASLSSTVAPATGPTLPSGYTHWAYAGAVRIDGSGNLLTTRIVGNKYFLNQQSVLSAGTATTETAIAVSSFVPPNALDFRIQYRNGRSNSANEDLKFRWTTGVEYFVAENNAAINLVFNGILDLPNLSQQFYYLWGAAPAVGADIYVIGGTLDNGAA